MHSPMEQFEIKRLLHLNLFGIDASFTNSSTWMIIAVILATTVFVWGMRQRALVPGRLQSVADGAVTVTLEKEKGATARIPLEKIAHGRLEVEFK